MTVVNSRTHTPASNDLYIGRPSILGNAIYADALADTLWTHLSTARLNYFQHLLDIPGIS